MTSGVSPAETMVANFSKAWPQGSEVISTWVPGLSFSNPATMLFSVSVRSGLVITSTSFSVVSAAAGADRDERQDGCKQQAFQHRISPQVFRLYRLAD